MPKWEIGKTYKTVDGRDAKLVAHLHSSVKNPLIFIIQTAKGNEYVAHRTEQGYLWEDGYHRNQDVVPPEPDKTSRFVNVYRVGVGGGYETIDQARSMVPGWKPSLGVLEIQFEDDEYVGTVFHPKLKDNNK